MKKILIIDTGGTFNKQYNPIEGFLEVDSGSQALLDISQKWQTEFEILSIIGKDSLEFTSGDRVLLLGTINLSDYEDIIVIHGTDTMDTTAAYLADAEMEKRVLLTGAMTPYSIDPVEAVANFASAFGYIQLLQESGIYIAMHGIIAPYDKIAKERKIGRFVANNTKDTTA